MTVTTAAAEMAGHGQISGRNKRSTRWTAEVDKAVKDKRSDGKMLQKDVIKKLKLEK